MSDRFFDAWALPAWAHGPAGIAEVAGGASEAVRVRYPAASADWMRELAGGLRERTVQGPTDDAGGLLGPAAADRRAVTLGNVGARFADPGDPLRRAALRLLPPTSGLSPDMARLVLDGMARDWTTPRLRRLLRAELGGPESLARFVDVEGRRSMAVAPRLCTQLVAGSVPGVGVTALIRTLLLGSPTLLKPGLGDVVLPVLFARGLREEAPELADALAVAYWPGGLETMEDPALAAAEVVVAYGSDAVVSSLRRRVPVTARVVGYHHREGVGVVGREDLTDPETARAIAERVARAVAVFDQRGCVSPRVLWVEDAGTAVTPAVLADRVADALSRMESTLPSGALDPSERSAVQQLRGTAEMLASGWDRRAGDAPTLKHGEGAPWTVVYDPHRSVDMSCVGRTVVVRPFRTLDELVQELRPAARHLQTVGVSGLGDRLLEVAEALGRLGVSRVAPFEAVPFPPPWWHHDGRGPLTDLVRWVDLEHDAQEIDG